MFKIKRMRWPCSVILFICYFKAWRLVQCYHYDVEAEAMKLYGEDLDTVLKKFRRTPQYMDILQERINIIYEELSVITDQVAHVYGNNMILKRINETLSKDHFDDSTANKSKANSWRPSLNPVETIDYRLAKMPFSAAERNAFKDIGYEVAGLAIHKMIASMGPANDEDEFSTRMPSDDKKVTTPTHHAEKHTLKPKAKILRVEDVQKDVYTFRAGKNTKGKYTTGTDKTSKRSNFENTLQMDTSGTTARKTTTWAIGMPYFGFTP